MKTLEEINEQIQRYVSTHGSDLPSDLIQLLSELDLAVDPSSRAATWRRLRFEPPGPPISMWSPEPWELQ